MRSAFLNIRSGTYVWGKMRTAKIAITVAGRDCDADGHLFDAMSRVVARSATAQAIYRPSNLC